MFKYNYSGFFLDTNENISIGIPNIQRSCAAVNTPAACVNKAINQIQDLEVKLEESFLQVIFICIVLVTISIKKLTVDVRISREIKIFFAAK